MATMHFTTTTTATPEQFVAAITDFGPGRSQIFGNTDDGQLVGSFALQRRILMTYEQCPRILYNAVTSIEDQHFEEHWGIDFPRIAARTAGCDRPRRTAARAAGVASFTMWDSDLAS